MSFPRRSDRIALRLGGASVADMEIGPQSQKTAPVRGTPKPSGVFGRHRGTSSGRPHCTNKLCQAKSFPSLSNDLGVNLQTRMRW